jgi:hypothetical protein
LNSNALFLLGTKRNTTSLNEVLNGYLTQFVFDNGWARYIEGFDAPTTVTPDPEYTVLLLNANSLATAGKDDSGRGHDFGFYWSGDPTVSNIGFAPPLLNASGGPA